VPPSLPVLLQLSDNFPLKLTLIKMSQLDRRLNEFVEGDYLNRHITDKYPRPTFRGALAPMASYSSVADRFKAVKEKDEKEIDGLLKRLDDYEARRDQEVLPRGHDFITAKTKEMGELENGLNQLSNAIPLEGDGDKPPKS
jgi:hypothetical protein